MLKINRNLLFIGGYIVALALLAFFGYLTIGRWQNDASKSDVVMALPTTTADKAFYTLPRMNLSLASAQKGNSLVRITIALEVDKRNLDRLAGLQPRISDRIITYLRKKNLDQLREPNYALQLHDELMLEIQSSGVPVPIADMYFREFIVW
ncbi:MAG: flagellar basal body-associated FliL family protein [Alphaproteobacteria bacterium]|nr:flagellar basal body-associated FliL family protein [Alphaproteobacteria bacterium]